MQTCFLHNLISSFSYFSTVLQSYVVTTGPCSKGMLRAQIPARPPNRVYKQTLVEHAGRRSLRS